MSYPLTQAAPVFFRRLGSLNPAVILDLQPGESAYQGIIVRVTYHTLTTQHLLYMQICHFLACKQHNNSRLHATTV